jgi:hypothetical protein
MALRLMAPFIIAWSLTASCPQSFAQELEPFLDAEITTDEWQATRSGCASSVRTIRRECADATGGAFHN